MTFSPALRARLAEIDKMPQDAPLSPEQEAECERAKREGGTLSTDDILRTLGAMFIDEEPAAAAE